MKRTLLSVLMATSVIMPSVGLGEKVSQVAFWKNFFEKRLVADRSKVPAEFLPAIKNIILGYLKLQSGDGISDKDSEKLETIILQSLDSGRIFSELTEAIPIISEGTEESLLEFLDDVYSKILGDLEELFRKQPYQTSEYLAKASEALERILKGIYYIIENHTYFRKVWHFDGDIKERLSGIGNVIKQIGESHELLPGLLELKPNEIIVGAKRADKLEGTLKGLAEHNYCWGFRVRCQLESFAPLKMGLSLLCFSEGLRVLVVCINNHTPVEMDNKCVEIIAELVKKHRIRELDLHGYHIKDVVWPSLGEAIEKSETLEVLNLNDCDIHSYQQYQWSSVRSLHVKTDCIDLSKWIEMAECIDIFELDFLWYWFDDSMLARFECGKPLFQVEGKLADQRGCSISPDGQTLHYFVDDSTGLGRFLLIMNFVDVKKETITAIHFGWWCNHRYSLEKILKYIIDYMKNVKIVYLSSLNFLWDEDDKERLIGFVKDKQSEMQLKFSYGSRSRCE